MISTHDPLLSFGQIFLSICVISSLNFIIADSSQSQTNFFKIERTSCVQITSSFEIKSQNLEELKKNWTAELINPDFEIF